MILSNISSNAFVRFVVFVSWLYATSQIYGHRFVIQVFQVLYTVCRTLCDWNFHFFAATTTQSCSLIPRRPFPLILPILLRRTLCVLPFIFENRGSTSSLPINKPPCIFACARASRTLCELCTQDRLLNIFITSEKLWHRLCVYARWARWATVRNVRKLTDETLSEVSTSTLVWSAEFRN